MHETARLDMVRDGESFSITVPDLKAGQLYGYRIDGPYDPDKGLFHDPAKLLADPYATRFDRPWFNGIIRFWLVPAMGTTFTG